MVNISIWDGISELNIGHIICFNGEYSVVISKPNDKWCNLRLTRTKQINNVNIAALSAPKMIKWATQYGLHVSAQMKQEEEKLKYKQENALIKIG